jgi:hypothetical protein
MTYCTSPQRYVAGIRQIYTIYTLHIHRIWLNFTKYGKYTVDMQRIYCVYLAYSGYVSLRTGAVRHLSRFIRYTLILRFFFQLHIILTWDTKYTIKLGIGDTYTVTSYENTFSFGKSSYTHWYNYSWDTPGQWEEKEYVSDEKWASWTNTSLVYSSVKELISSHHSGTSVIISIEHAKQFYNKLAPLQCEKQQECIIM